MQSFRMKLCSLWHWRPAPTSGFATRCIPFGYEVQPQTLAIWLGRIDSETVLPVIVNSDYARQGSFDVTREAPLSNSEGGEQKLRAEGKYKTNTHTQRHTDTHRHNAKADQKIGDWPNLRAGLQYGTIFPCLLQNQGIDEGCRGRHLSQQCIFALLAWALAFA